MRHKLSQLLQRSYQQNDVCLLARAACNALIGVPAHVTCPALPHVRSAASAAAQQHQQQQQQHDQHQQQVGVLLQKQRWLLPPSAGLQQYLTTQQQQAEQNVSSNPRQPGAQETPSNSSSSSTQEDISESENPSKEGKSSNNNTNTSTGGDAADNGSSSGSGKGAPDEALLAEWRSASAEWYGSGLNYIVHGHLDMPNMSSWSHLYRSPPGLLSHLIWPKGASAMTRVLRWNFAKASTVAVALLEEAHGDFEVEEFKQCASEAVAEVLERYAASDWAALRPMVSSGLLQSMQQAHEEQQPASNVHVDVTQLDIMCVHSITQQQLAAIDEQRAGQQITPAELEAAAGAESADGAGAAATAAAGQSYWDVVHVYVEAEWHGAVKLADDAAASEVVQPRSGHWMLCRGPVLLNKAIPAEAEKPWFMLAWM